ncbi:hypothetical protein I6N90_12300 [Paenibacillus sp. GSMTC-2017]|uniref:hypothetical protein n=1 Tax=Paenibacillus sp. GSMTC-2017 TaxID=2794350 RepID=UPI0018D75C66|nr:hypothetical protein [Paenibacillus sp. GSMTC-2017]MBH5318577.1 hypothetical protein [Paenibacillus sp. GSMTC-2017]
MRKLLLLCLALLILFGLSANVKKKTEIEVASTDHSPSHEFTITTKSQSSPLTVKSNMITEINAMDTSIFQSIINDSSEKTPYIKLGETIQ